MATKKLLKLQCEDESTKIMKYEVQTTANEIKEQFRVRFKPEDASALFFLFFPPLPPFLTFFRTAVQAVHPGGRPLDRRQCNSGFLWT